MALMKWDESPHWNKPKVLTPPDTYEEDEPLVEPELPALTNPHTVKEITEAILDDPRYNAMNPSNQQHIINMALAQAEKSGMLIKVMEETVNG